MTIGIRHVFTQRWTVLWATTYTYGLLGFDDYFLGQLRREGINITILADHGALADMWAALTDAELPIRLQRINRDYMLRPIAWHSRAFHPKTYLFGDDAGGRLLVGSGNADVNGLVAGHEVFASFSSSDDTGLNAIAQWRAWMDTIVGQLDDAVVAARWEDAKNRLPWLPATAGGSAPLLMNFDAPIADQFLDGVRSPVDELHVSSPFWDSELGALSYLLDRTRARSLHLYLGAGTRVDGARLIEVIEKRGLAATLWTYNESDFVHAKLVAWIRDGRGRLLSGSANVSYAAMLSSARGEGNVEVGVHASGLADEIRATFCPVGLELRPLAVSELTQFTAELPPPHAELPIKLIRAERMADGHLSVAMTPAPNHGTGLASCGVDEPPVVLHIVETDGTELYPQLARGRTQVAWESNAGLVMLVNSEGSPLSNPVSIDDPIALDAALYPRDASERGALNELSWDELDTPVGRILEELQTHCVFEPRRAPRKHPAVVAERTATEADSAFWERVGDIDVDVIQGQRRSRFGRGQLDSDPIFAQLRAMLVQAPYLPELIAIRSLISADEEDEDIDPEAARRRWAIETRQRVRVMNVLKRWCRAVRDPTLFAIDPFISVHNYRALLQALGELWIGAGDGKRYFDEEHLHELLRILLESLVASSGTNKGVLTASDDATRTALVRDLQEHGATTEVAVLMFDVLRPERRDRARRALEWQPLLLAAIAAEVLDPGDGPIGEAIRWATDYVDEDGWRRRIRDRYGVDARFSEAKLGAGYDYTLILAGVGDLLQSSTAVAIVQAALAFRPAHGIRIASVDDGGRISIQDGQHAFGLVRGHGYESEGPISLDAIRDLNPTNGLSFLFAASTTSAAG